MYYPEEVVDEVARSNDIVDLVGQYVKLKRSGNRYTGLCPFHNEKTPSFFVSGDTQLYYCFGCGAGGNIYKFVMEYENFSFQEAVKYLADRSGIKLPEESKGPNREEEDKRKQMLEANKEAAKYYHYILKSQYGERAYNYLKGRALSDETITKFGLGYSPAGSNSLYKYLKKKGFSDEVLAGAGLIRVDERGVYDRFWNRVMFPIMDINNRVIGFGGRVMGDALPKYLNSPETKLFDKSRNLYGLHAAKKSRKDYFLLCEGYMDVIALHQAGFTNAVAALGTAFTPQHASLISRYVKKVVCTFDSDGAGINAALRAIPILKSAGLSVKVLNMKPHKDPDEFIKAKGAEAYEKRIESAKNSFLFEIGIMKSRYNFQDPEQLTRFQNETARKLLEFEDEMERNNYVEAVANEYGMNVQSLKRKVNQMGLGYVPKDYTMERDEVVKKDERVINMEKKRRSDTSDKKAQRMLLLWITSFPEAFSQVKGLVRPTDFLVEEYAKLADLIYDCLEEGREVKPAEIMTHFMNDGKDHSMISEVFSATVDISEDKNKNEQIFTDLVRRVKMDSLRVAGRDADLAMFGQIRKQTEQLKKFKIHL